MVKKNETNEILVPILHPEAVGNDFSNDIYRLRRSFPYPNNRGVVQRADKYVKFIPLADFNAILPAVIS